MRAGSETFERAWESSISDEITVAENGIYSRLFWEGDVLVFDCGSQAADQKWSMVWQYQLVDSGQRLRAVEQMHGRGDFDNTWVFEKSAEPVPFSQPSADS